MFLKVINTGSLKGNCYVLQSKHGSRLLLDCGCKYNKILKGIEYKTIATVGCLLTHEHGDHLKSFKNLLEVGIDVYAHPETATFISSRYGESVMRCLEMRPFYLGEEYKIIPFNLPHTSYDKESKELVTCPNYGYMIEHGGMGRLLYMTDFEYCKYSFKATTINHFVIECNYCEDMVDKESANYGHRLKGHCSLSTCKEFLKQNISEQTRTITLVHLSDTAADADRIQKEIQETVGNKILVQIARSGLEVNLNLCPF